MAYSLKNRVKSAVQISVADLSPELQPLPSSNILMVEVDNVQHEQFTVTEEVKVRPCTHTCTRPPAKQMFT